MRRFRLRWIAVGLIVAVGLYFALDIVALQYLQSRVSNELARALAAEDATVKLGGVPFLPSFVRGRLNHVELDVKGATGTGGLRVDSISARMADVRFQWGPVLSLARSIFSTRTEVKIGQPFGILDLTESDLSDFLKAHVAQLAEVKVRRTGIEMRFLLKPLKKGAQPTDKDMTPPARFLPRVENRKLVLSLVGLTNVPEPLRPVARKIEGLIQLPEIPQGLRLDIRLGDGVVTVEGAGKDLTLNVGEGES